MPKLTEQLHDGALRFRNHRSGGRRLEVCWRGGEIVEGCRLATRSFTLNLEMAWPQQLPGNGDGKLSEMLCWLGKLVSRFTLTISSAFANAFTFLCHCSAHLRLSLSRADSLSAGRLLRALSLRRRRRRHRHRRGRLRLKSDLKLELLRNNGARK